MNPDARLRDQALEESPVPRIVVDANGLLAIANARARELFSIYVKDLGRPPPRTWKSVTARPSCTRRSRKRMRSVAP